LRPFLSLIDLSCKPEGVENIAAVAGLEKWESRVVCGISKLRGKVVV